MATEETNTALAGYVADLHAKLREAETAQRAAQEIQSLRKELDDLRAQHCGIRLDIARAERQRETLALTEAERELIILAQIGLADALVGRKDFRRTLLAAAGYTANGAGWKGPGGDWVGMMGAAWRRYLADALRSNTAQRMVAALDEEERARGGDDRPVAPLLAHANEGMVTVD